MRKSVAMLLLCLIVHGIAFARATDEQVLYNGKIFSGEPEHPYAAAAAIKCDKIVAVGNPDDVAKAVTSGAGRIDLKGNLLLPRLIDSHCHVIDGGLSLISAVVEENIATIDKLAGVAVDAKKTGRGMQGDILVVGGIPLAFWSKNKELNDRFSAGEYAFQPVLLEAWTAIPHRQKGSAEARRD